MNGRRMLRYVIGIVAVGVLGAGLAVAQAATGYQPKFKGDPAHSESEAQALGYMRVVLRAEHAYKKKHGKFAPSLKALAGTGTFTPRMAHDTVRGDYTINFVYRAERPDREQFALTMTPKQMDGEHRSFYAEDNGVIHADDSKAADSSSPKVQ
jgi:hypothetical protein